METTVEVRRTKLDDGREPWLTYVDGELSSVIEIDDDSTVRIYSDETAIRVFISERGKQPKVDVILDRGEGLLIDAGALAAALGSGDHHPFAVVGLEDSTFALAEFRLSN